jgi:hypothetical protein
LLLRSVDRGSHGHATSVASAIERQKIDCRPNVPFPGNPGKGEKATIFFLALKKNGNVAM